MFDLEPMGQTTGAKPRTPRRTKPWVFASCNLSSSEQGTWNSNDGGEGDKGRECCDHYKKDCVGSNLLLLEFRTISINKVCEECFVEPRKWGIEEHYELIGKKDGEKTLDTSSQPQFIWVCLDCNRCLCGGAANDSEPHGHVRQHAMLEGHPWAARADDPDFVWCFQCNSLVRIQMPEGGTGEAESMTKVEVEGFIGGVESKKEMEDGSKDLIIGSGKSYAVRGLKNLGNTCFFNSVMQNLLAMNMFRDNVMILEWLVGPLATEMKKFLLETSAAEGSEVVLNPSGLFECICAKEPRFQGFQQQDSHELLRCLLDGLCTEERTAASSFISSSGQHKMMANSGSTFVEAIFGGELSSTITCVECGHTSTVYEPFLDLSLPVPSKISSSKNVPLALSKRSIREGANIAEGSPLIKRQKTENLSPASECNESCIPPVEQAVSLGMQGILIGIDYDASIAVLDGADSTSQMCDVPVARYFESGLVFQGENNSQCTSDSQTGICSKENIASLDVCGESSSRNENVSSCIQDSGVILLPYKNLDPALDEINRATQNQENVTFMSSKVKEYSARSTHASSGEAEVNLGVLDDLLDEPEITSDCKTGTAAGENIDFTLWAGSHSESDQEEVDDTDGPVLVDRCLALFTKSELLSDEHAWHCEQCSGNSLLHDLGYGKSKSQASASLDQSETLNSQVDGSEVRSKTASLSLEVDYGKMASTPENLVNVERLIYAHTTRDVSQNVLDFTGILDGTTCKYGQAENEKISESLGPILIDQIQCPDVLQKDRNFAESSRTSQYIPCPAAQEISFLQESPGNLQSDSCSVNDQLYVECGQPAQPAASSCSRDHPETFLQSSCDNDNFSEINQIGKEGSQLFGKVNPTKDGRSHEMELKSRKVKRDATIRVLINKTPPILTIHLKRFNQDAKGRLNKLRGHVSFQETLDIGPYMDLRHGEKQCCYQLIGMVEHLGTMTGGHYIAYVRGERSQGKAKNGSSPAWFRASDAQVHEVSVSEVLQSEAYILFYERV